MKVEKFESFAEWNKFNESLTGVSLKKWKPSTVSKQCLLIIFYPYSLKGSNVKQKPLITIHKIKFLYKDKVFYLKDNEVVGKSWANNLLIIPKKKLPELNKLTKRFVSFYSSWLNKLTEVEKKRDAWIREQTQKIYKEAKERFKLDLPSEINIIDIFSEESLLGKYSYYCTSCEQFFAFDKRTGKCPKCGRKLKKASDKMIDTHILVDKDLLKKLKEQ